MSSKKVKLAKKFIKKTIEAEAFEKWAELAESFRKQLMEMIRDMDFKDRVKFAIKVILKRI